VGDLKEKIQVFIKQHQLPLHYESAVRRLLLPFSEKLAALIFSTHQPFVLGISGPQGAGKSTLASLLSLLWQAQLEQSQRNTTIVTLSLDDFYYSHEQRQQLASNIHPLLATRGVPGTHDIAFALRTLESLKQLAADETIAVPKFDKATDNPFPEEQWPVICGPVDLIILEGWCLGARAQINETLIAPINVLEQSEDADGRWRHYVNECLKANYQSFFQLIDHLMYLQVPSFGCVYQWRALQEENLRKQSKLTSSRLMTEKQLIRFIQHYERITVTSMDSLPSCADTLLTLDNQHRMIDLVSK